MGEGTFWIVVGVCLFVGAMALSLSEYFFGEEGEDDD